MKLATYKDGSRDGQLVVVSRDLSSAHYASGIATRLQQVLDDWNFISPQLEDLSSTLSLGKARHAFAFDPRLCMAPLPRAFQWASVWAAAAPPSRVPSVLPNLLQHAGDDLQGACDAIACAEGDAGRAVAAELAAVTGDVAMRSAPEAALECVRLLMLAARLQPLDAASDASQPQPQPAASFGPVAVTPDELGTAWRRGRVHLALACTRNGRVAAAFDAAAAMPFHFGELIAHLSATRRVRAGSIVGSGSIGPPEAAPMRPGDALRIDLVGADGISVFGAVEPRLQAFPR